jgi:protein-S-isoprenylcysteine O-methyltransferase
MKVALVGIVCFVVLAVHIWLLFFHRYKMGTKNSDQPKDRYFSKWGMRISFMFQVVYAFLLIGRRVLLEAGLWSSLDIGIFRASLDLLPISNLDIFLVLGSLFFAAGVAVRVWAVKTLGQFFTFEIGIRGEHHIIDSGPYAWVRHPSYTGYFFMLLGTGFILGSWMYIMIVPLGALTFFAVRIPHEEAMLKAHFGQKYLEYSKSTKKIIPYII